MLSPQEARILTRELLPTDLKRAVKFNETARDEDIIVYSMLLEQNKLPRQVFIHGYQAMFTAAALYLAKKHHVKIYAHVGGAHKNMRDLIEFYTQDKKQNKKLVQLYETAIERYRKLSQQYQTGQHFARRVAKDLLYAGYNKGKKIAYPDTNTIKKDPLELDFDDAKEFIADTVEPFLFIIGEIIDD